MIRVNTRILILSRTRTLKFLPGLTGISPTDHKFTLRYNDVVGTSDQETNATSGPPNNPP